ncbi:hypothetical protein E2C01_025154 [Portunus trituberculatus]|uniref:Uncharacterized protein n=1 Tax=Portunus trituberculatus TaxID=210409 RepID=A0A5B7EH32_PORTR|nr:hypothetical protein [Portunus trituberculatus]
MRTDRIASRVRRTCGEEELRLALRAGFSKALNSSGVWQSGATLSLVGCVLWLASGSSSERDLGMPSSGSGCSSEAWPGKSSSCRVMLVSESSEDRDRRTRCCPRQKLDILAGEREPSEEAAAANCSLVVSMGRRKRVGEGVPSSSGCQDRSEERRTSLGCGAAAASCSR